jgi:osmotically-inducible protein OsmY
MARLFSFVVLFSGIALLAACGPVGLVVGGAATAGYAGAQERGFKGAVSDVKIQAQINDLWFKRSFDMFQRVNMTVHEGRVLLTGFVPTQEMRMEAVRLAWKAEGVREIINEIQVDRAPGPLTDAKDIWITTQLRTKIMLAKDVDAINYSIETINGVIYLMGIAQSARELEIVTDIARKIDGVEKVLSYVRVKTTPMAATAGPADSADVSGVMEPGPVSDEPVVFEPITEPVEATPLSPDEPQEDE